MFYLTEGTRDMNAFYCVGTHWDREWYEPFQEFRAWLVELIDELMDLIEKDPEYKCFHLDGQTIVIEDYLEIRPDQKDRVMRHLHERTLLVGPWYNLPDEWLVSGESLIRNLQRGLKLCKEWQVKPLDFAYTPDQFGHIAALPMIMRGFGLRAGIVWRGTQDETHPAQFIWVGPDGSRMAYCKLMDKGSYAPFDFLARRPIKEANYSEESFKQHFEPYFEEEKKRGAAPVVLLLDAIDHQRPDPEMPSLLQKLRQRYPDIDFIWGTLEDYGQEILKYAEKYPTYQGELREPARDSKRGGQYLIVHTISSRVDLKLRNDKCAALLERWCEPYGLFSRMENCEPVPGYLEKAWQYLLRNHPHDSICGCSIDQVHRDMQYRFDQAFLLGDGYVRRALASLGKATADVGSWRFITVHNPLPIAGKRVINAALYFPSDYAAQTGHTFHDGLATGEEYNKFHLLDSTGQRLTYQHCKIERGIECRRLTDNGRETIVGGDIYHVVVEVDLPSCGMTGIAIEGTDDATRTFGSLLTGSLAASNGLVSLEIGPAGDVSISTPNGLAFNKLFLYEDAGDCGDGWTRGIPINDIVFRSYGSTVTTAIEENGPLRVTFRIERQFYLPKKFEGKSKSRSEERIALTVTDFLSIEKHCPAVKVRTIIHNTVEDHRLRILFPSQRKTDKSFADSPFSVVERMIPIPSHSALWQERINEEKPFTSFCGLSDKEGGLAIVSPAGLHEYAVLDTPDRELAVTLFRAFRKTVGKPEEVDGQLQRTIEVEYALLPFDGEPPWTEFFLLTALQQVSPRLHGAGHLATPKSFLHVESQGAVVTAIKPAVDGMSGIIRFWNPGKEKVRSRFGLDRPIKSAYYCDLKEEIMGPCTVDHGSVVVETPAAGLSTILFDW